MISVGDYKTFLHKYHILFKEIYPDYDYALKHKILYRVKKSHYMGCGMYNLSFMDISIRVFLWKEGKLDDFTLECV